VLIGSSSVARGCVRYPTSEEESTVLAVLHCGGEGFLRMWRRTVSVGTGAVRRGLRPVPAPYWTCEKRPARPMQTVKPPRKAEPRGERSSPGLMLWLAEHDRRDGRGDRGHDR
jgi:hypothetical protein